MKFNVLINSSYLSLQSESSYVLTNIIAKKSMPAIQGAKKFVKDHVPNFNNKKDNNENEEDKKEENKEEEQKHE